MENSKLRVLITGATGQLGFAVAECLQYNDIEYCGTSSKDFDITDSIAVEKFICAYKPNVVIHCAAYTAVDKAEEDVECCFAVNAQATEHIASICRTLDAKMLYISTDYVFSGNEDGFYEVDSPVNPQNAYGRSKLEGENAVKEFLDKFFIVRTSWVFGKHGNNFVKTMLRLGKENAEMKVVTDQVGSPTYTTDLANLIFAMINTDKDGVYHATNTGECSWAELAAEIFKISGYDCKVMPIMTSEYPSKAIRPKNSKLNKESIRDFGMLPTWQNALSIFLAGVEREKI